MAEDFIPVAVPDIGELERRYVAEAVDSGWISSIGTFVGRFEEEFARFCGTGQAVAVSNGTTALEVVLKAMGVGPGDEVVLPAFTFAAVPAAVVHVGAQPVLVDVDPEHWCLDPQAVERAVGPSTKVVIAVHSYGHPADMDRILEICRSRGVRVLEDCAEAHGARYRGKVVGSLGDAGTFSFYGNKIITTGEGGMVVTDDEQLAERVRMLKDHAMDPHRRYYHLEAGYNFRMTNVQAAMGCAQLERVREFLDTRERQLTAYRASLAEFAGVRLNPRMSWAQPVNWLACAVLPRELVAGRDRLLARLRESGVDTRPFFVPLNEMPPYRGTSTVGARSGELPVTAMLARAGFNLPTSTAFTDDQIARVCDRLRHCLRDLMPRGTSAGT